MPGLSNMFSSDDSTSSNDQNASGTLVGDADGVLGVDATSSQTNESTDGDGNASSLTNDNALSVGSSTDGLLGGMGETFSSNDESTA